MQSLLRLISPPRKRVSLRSLSRPKTCKGVRARSRSRSKTKRSGSPSRRKSRTVKRR